MYIYVLNVLIQCMYINIYICALSRRAKAKWAVLKCCADVKRCVFLKSRVLKSPNCSSNPFCKRDLNFSLDPICERDTSSLKSHVLKRPASFLGFLTQKRPKLFLKSLVQKGPFNYFANILCNVVCT